MALRDEFESVRASILHESPLPTVDAAMTKVLTEETRNGINPDINSVFVAHRSYNTFQKGNPDIPQRDLSQIQCRYCKEYIWTQGQLLSSSQLSLYEAEEKLNYYCIIYSSLCSI